LIEVQFVFVIIKKIKQKLTCDHWEHNLIKKINLILILTTSLLLSSCAYLGLDDADEGEDSPAVETVQHSETKSLQTKDPAQAEVTKASIETHEAPAQIAAATNGIPAEKALGWLKNGNIRYLKGNLRKDGQSKKDIARLAGAQNPHSVILTCSDSRVVPEIIFDQKLGEIFVIRTLDHSASPATIASIEYALVRLGVQNLVVMGSTSSKVTEDLACSNSAPIVEALIAKSPVIAELIHSGHTQMVQAQYHLDSGKVDFSR
jgi:carbonic anhydrase